jgi:hypothetical protein
MAASTADQHMVCRLHTVQAASNMGKSQHQHAMIEASTVLAAMSVLQ